MSLRDIPNQPLEEAAEKVHTLKVFTDGDERWYEIEHRDDCPRVEHHQFYEGGKVPTEIVTEYTCAVQYETDNAGLDSLRFQWERYLPDGEYQIIAWHEYYPGGPWGGPEGDGGLDLIDDQKIVWQDLQEPSSGMMFNPEKLTEWVEENAQRQEPTEEVQST